MALAQTQGLLRKVRMKSWGSTPENSSRQRPERVERDICACLLRDRLFETASGHRPCLWASPAHHRTSTSILLSVRNTQDTQDKGSISMVSTPARLATAFHPDQKREEKSSAAVVVTRIGLSTRAPSSLPSPRAIFVRRIGFGP